MSITMKNININTIYNFNLNGGGGDWGYEGVSDAGLGS